jgi:hypothetical protein|tara:strand:- start:2 stop:184 length:183 start_codon:yes stop_codon:yes gene_type:complete
MTTINKIKKWLRDEIKYNEEIVNAKDNKLEPICSDGTDDISYGRSECAEALLRQIKEWGL